MADFLEEGKTAVAENTQVQDVEKNTEVSTTTNEANEVKSQVENNAKVSGEEKQILDINDLNDELYGKLVSRIASDQKLPYHKNPAWIRNITQRNQALQKADILFKRYAEKDPQGAVEMLLDEGLDEPQALAKLHSMGVDVNSHAGQSEQPAREVAPNTNVDEGEFIKLLNNMGVKYEQLDPEQIKFWKFNYQFNRQMMQPVQKFVEKTEAEKKKQAEAEKFKSYENEEKELAKMVKEKYGMDWEKECLPEIFSYLKDNPKYSGTPRQLFKEVFFDKVEELGKRAKSIEDSKLNDEKKRITSEDGGSKGGETKPSGVGKHWPSTWAYLENKYKK